MHEGIGRWLGSRHVGASSSVLAAAMLGYVPDHSPSYPHDSDDFGRCAYLCGCAPDYKAIGLARLAAVSAIWKRLAERWDELVELHGKDIKACDRLVRHLTRGDLGSGMYESRKDENGLWDYFKVHDFSKSA